MTIKIAFMGKMCSGKSTICHYLQSLQPEFVILSFAAKIKEIARDLFDMNFKDRQLLQHIGSKMREIDPDVFSKYLIRQSKKHEFVLVDDARYPNELTYLKKNGFTLVKLVISPQLQRKRIEKLYGDQSQEHLSRLDHPSEILQDQIDNQLFDTIIDVEKEDVKKKVAQLFFQDKI
jgi:hypothetical protein